MLCVAALWLLRYYLINELLLKIYEEKAPLLSRYHGGKRHFLWAEKPNHGVTKSQVKYSPCKFIRHHYAITRDWIVHYFWFPQCGHLTQRQSAGHLWKQKETYQLVFCFQNVAIASLLNVHVRRLIDFKNAYQQISNHKLIFYQNFW